MESENRLRFTNLTNDDGLSQNTIHGIVKDKYGFVWFGTWEGVCRYDGYQFKVFRADKETSSGILNNRIDYLFIDSLLNLWVVNGDGHFAEYSYQYEAFNNVHPDSVPGYIQDGLRRNKWSRTHVSGNGFEWAVERSSKKLFQRNRIGEELIYGDKLGGNESICEEDLTDLYFDNHDILWVGTEAGGVYKADTRSKPFKNYYHSPFDNNTLVDNVVKSIVEDKEGNIWVGTFSNGITVIKRDGRYVHYKHDPLNNNSVIDNQIRYLYCDHYGDVWIATKNGLSRFSAKTNRFESSYTQLNGTIPDKRVFWVMEDHNNDLWIGTFNGFARLNRELDTFIGYDPTKFLNTPRVRTILEDKNNNLWIGTEGGGISVLERDSDFITTGELKRIKDYQFIPGDKNSIVANIVLTLLEDKDYNIWIGTNNGLCCLNPKSDKLIRMTVETGFPDELIMGMLTDNAGDIWVSHIKGLTRITKSKDGWGFRTYNKDDGLPGNEFNQNAFFKSSISNRFYFGGSKGLTVFDADSIRDNPFLPNVYITRLRVQNKWIEVGEIFQDKVILSQSLILTSEIEIEYNYKSFSVEFVGLHYSNPSGNKYKYMLDGFDQGWIEADAGRRIAGYSNLNDGKYFFKVMAANSDGVWNPNPVQLIITVLPPWWRTWWAYLLYVIVIALVIVILFRLLFWREKLKQELEIEKIRNEKDQEVNAAKLEFFTSVSHEIRTPLSLIIDPLDQLVKGEVPKNKESSVLLLIQKNAKRLHDLINQLLDFRKVEVGQETLHFKEVKLFEFLNDILSRFEYQSEKRKIDFRIEYLSFDQSCSIDADKVEKIVVNIVSNAFKYTPDGGIIIVQMIIEQQFLKLLVKDSGIGISLEAQKGIFNPFYSNASIKPFAGESTGIGLALVKKLVDLLGGEIKLVSEIGEGTCFELLLPFVKVLGSDNSITDDYDGGICNNNEINNEDCFEILVVDDEKDIQIYLQQVLQKKYRVYVANDGLEGFTIAQDRIPDLIISDVMMPVMDGMAMSSKLKLDERTSHIPIILLTAKVSHEAKIEGFGTGADLYHDKPFNSELLQMQIISLIDNRKRLQGYYSHNLVSVKTTESLDDIFMRKAQQYILEKVSDVSFNQQMLAVHLSVSQRQLYRKIDALTGKTVHDYINSVRLNKAKELLQNKDLTITEIAEMVGFSELSNFSRSFSKQFGVSPGKYRKGG
ncbi:MAG: helix-turn-helix domain-containing protein [Marinilabiliaceae bacterium]|nr:helix-turn-helix domain-containing protein [Marinilabiliaceae bacterium]